MGAGEKSYSNFGKEVESVADSAKKPDYRKTKDFKALKKAMLEKLALRGMNERSYTDKVEEYLDFWVRRRELRDDVNTRGLTVTDERGRLSENRSVSLEIQVSRQMLALFTALGFKPEDCEGGCGADDEL